MIIKLKNTLQIFIVLFTMLQIAGCGNKNADVNLIPEPLELIVNSGSFTIGENTVIIVDTDNPKVKEVANYFVEQFNRASGYSIRILVSSEKSNVKNSIIFTDKNLDASLGDEGYKLISDEDEIILTGTLHGLFYGVQTLFQLLPVESYNSKTTANINWKIPSVEILDKPRFKWRGMHLDVGRHIFPVPFIKKYIDYIAMHKMNTFHWHLTEDQGWRIEIKKYPKLTEIGAWRKGTSLAFVNKSGEIDEIRYGGFYTQDEIREVVKYAEERFVTVVPEIELPGHSVAALTAYPEYSCTGGPFEVRTMWGISDDIYCAGNDSVFTFLENILTEVLELFPSKYIHIGGDEAPKVRWEICPKCQLRIKQEGLKDEHGLQNYFITRIEKFLNSKGRKIIGWDEILEGGLAPNASVMSWRGIEGGISAAKQKHDVVMSPSSHCYFNEFQGKLNEKPRAMGGLLPLEKVYEYEPIPEELNEEEQKYIIGVQANVWTEYMTTSKRVEYMSLPRMCAIAEVAWSPKEKRNLPNFLNRMSTHYGRLDELEVNYRWPKLEGFNSRNVFIDKTVVEFISKRKGTEVRYTMDGSTPTKKTILYKKPFAISETTEINVIEIGSNGKISEVYNIHYIKQDPIKPVVIKEKKEGLKFEYFEFDEPIELTTELLKMKPVANGNVQKFVFPYENEKLPEQFGLIFNGFIEVPKEELYTFTVLSNDGSRLYIADKLVVENEGWHGAYPKDGGVALQAGLHKIQLLYFQAGGKKALKVFMKNSGSKKQKFQKVF